MILQRHAGLVVVALAILICGCSSSQQTTSTPAAPKQPADMPEPRVDASRPTIDPRILPPPRPALAGAPDLDHATFEVTDTALKAMTVSGLPANEAKSLASLKGRTYGNVTDFRAAVEDRLGKPATEAHIGAIMREALSVTLADAPEPPEGKAELQAAETLKRAGAQAAVIGVVAGSMGDSRFKPVFFDTDRAAVKDAFDKAISFNADVLKADKTLKVIIEGHCDERGRAAYNKALGEKRAEAVRDALVKAGVPAEQMTTISYGSDRPADPGHNPAAWRKNRRAVINLQ